MSAPADWPRPRWPEHPRWPRQALLLDSHEAFRGWSRWILERVRVLDPADDQRVAHRRRKLPRHRTDFDWWMRGMGGHERYEERKLYPFLARRWGVAFDDLVVGHEALNAAKRRVFAAFDTLVAGEPDEAVNHEALVDALEEHQRVLLAHLELEEDRVIPLLLELEPREFDDYVR